MEARGVEEEEVEVEGLLWDLQCTDLHLLAGLVPPGLPRP